MNIEEEVGLLVTSTPVPNRVELPHHAGTHIDMGACGLFIVVVLLITTMSARLK